jgi:DNA-binding beta-propeller fold protein YncE
MATSRDILCGICEAQHVTKYADHWCPECDEGLCATYENHHKLSKGTRNHGIILIENYQKLPSFISEIGHHCKDHDMKYTIFCQIHDKPCCPDCISTNHKDCVGLLSIREIIKTSKTSTLIADIEQSLTNIKYNIDDVIKNREQNLSEIQQQRQIFHDQVKQMRVKINSHLDILEQTILKELDDAEDKIKSKIENLLKQLSEESKTVEGIQRDIPAIKEYASDLQTFLGSKAIEEEVKKEEKYIMALSEDGCLQQLNLKCNIENKIKGILSTMTSFGSVSIETRPPSVAINTMKSKQAQIMSVIQGPSVKSINDIKLTLHNTFNIPKGKNTTTGCIVCPNGKMILADCYSNRRLVILNDDGTLDKVIPCSMGYPFDVTYLDDRTVAVATNNGIEIINIDTEKTGRRINISQWCCGITYHNGVLLWCEEKSGIQMMKLSNDIITTLVKQSNMPPYSYITTCREKIYQANRNTITVTCYTIKGDKLWEHKDEFVLSDPWGVTVDNDGNVYVTSYRSSSVVVLEPDGRQGRQILSSGDGFKEPRGIYFDKSKNCLLVTNYHGPSFLYHVC